MSLKRIGNLLRLLWNFGVAFGVVFYIVRYKLELGTFFSSVSDVRDAAQVWLFLSEKWGILLLGAVFLLTHVLLSIDAAKYMEQAENCFSRLRTPKNEWKNVREKCLIVWVVLSNIPIFLSAAYYTDNVAMFSGFLMAHHLNAVIWIAAFRWNVRHF